MNIRYTPEVLEELADKLDVWMDNPNNYWLGSFAAENKIHRKTLPYLVGKNEKFDAAYERAKNKQEEKLVLDGLSGKSNPSVVIFALKNVAGWRDTKDLKHSGEIKGRDVINIIQNGKGTEKYNNRVDREADRSSTVSDRQSK